MQEEDNIKIHDSRIIKNDRGNYEAQYYRYCPQTGKYNWITIFNSSNKKYVEKIAKDHSDSYGTTYHGLIE